MLPGVSSLSHRSLGIPNKAQKLVDFIIAVKKHALSVQSLIMCVGLLHSLHNVCVTYKILFAFIVITLVFIQSNVCV